MNGSTWRVARRELGGYLDQAAAYVLAIAFLSISLFLAFRSMYASGVASLRPFFDLLPILFAVFVPAATMRSLAEERRGHTLEWLLAQPLTETEVVLGKFLGVWFFVMLAVAGTLPTALGVLLASEADGGIVLAQYVGAGLLAGQLVAVGLWASSFTRNQITAFIVSAALAFTLFLMGLPVVQIGLPPAIGGAVARLSVLSHFENVARGVIDLRDVLYFGSTAGLFLVLAVGALSRERLSPGRADYRRMRVGAGVVALIVVVVNLLGSHVRGRLDLTRNHLYTLAQGTRDILGGLDDRVQIKLFASRELPPEVQLQLRDVRDVLADFRRASNGHVTVSEVSPDGDEKAAAEAGSYGVYPVEFNVLRDDEFQVRRGYYGLVVTYADDRNVIPVIQRTDDLEFRLASAIASMTSERKPTVSFVTDFGAKGPHDVSGLQESLADRYELRPVQIAGDSAPPLTPDSTAVVVLAGPVQPVDSLARQRLEGFLDAGGSALVLMDPVELDPQSPAAIPVHSDLDPLLEAHGVRFDPRLLFDLASSERVSMGRRGFLNVVAPYPLWPVAVPDGDHAITRDLSSLTLAWSGSLEIMDSTMVTPLWRTSEAGGLRGPGLSILPDQDWSVPRDQLAERTVAVAIDPANADGEAGSDGEAGTAEGASPLAGRMVVVGDASFVEDQFVQSNPQNLVFLANAIDWLAQDESLIHIRSKDRTPPALVFASDARRNFLKWGNLVGVPLLVALAGLLRVGGRRRRAEARWKEVVA